MNRKLSLLSILGLLGVALVWMTVQPSLRGQMKADKSAIAGTNAIAGMGSVRNGKGAQGIQGGQGLCQERGQERCLHGVYRRRAISSSRPASGQLRGDRREERVHRWRCTKGHGDSGDQCHGRLVARGGNVQSGSTDAPRSAEE